MDKIKGLLLALIIAIPSVWLGKQYPIVGAPVFGILIGMSIGMFMKKKSGYEAGLKFASKKILQYAVILLGFGLNLTVIVKTGKESLPIILTTIAISLIVAYIMYKMMKIDENIATLVGVGSSICGGSAIAATAPVIKASDEEIAQSISVVFLFNVLAAVSFPTLGLMLGFSSNAFGIFAGTAINDTSSVTAAASTWDSLFGLGSATLDKAVTVKLTRTLAIIPITLVLAYLKNKDKKKFDLKGVFPFFIIYFVLASIITTVAVNLGVQSSFFAPMKELSKFFIVMAMAAIGINTDLVKLLKTGYKPIILGFVCWISILSVSIGMQYILGLW